MIKFTSTFLMVTLMSVAPFQTQAQSIKDLDFLIGSWKVEETIYPGTDKEYKETGLRTCSYYLNETFIKCDSETTISTSGRKRYYAYHINYNSRDGYFNAVNFAHDFPRMGFFQWYLNKEEKEIRQVAPENVLRDRFFRSVISYENPDELVWEGWSSKFEEDKEWKQIFKDVATKVK